MRRTLEHGKSFFSVSDGIFYVLSRFNSKKPLRGNADQIDEANERILKRGEKNGVIRLRWWKNLKDVLCFSFKKNTFNLSETRAKVSDNVSAELSEKRQRLFVHNATSDFQYTFLDYIPGSNVGIRV